MPAAIARDLRTMLREVAAPYADSKPSVVCDVPWIYADRKDREYPPPTPQSGKWLVFVRLEQVDAMWKEVKVATEQGRLGHSSKVSTAKRNPNAIDPKAKVICVYTYDWTDRADAMRVRKELYRLGVKEPISYKTDQDTRDGRYSAKGDINISKYRE
jgi:hypothetical protein